VHSRTNLPTVGGRIHADVELSCREVFAEVLVLEKHQDFLLVPLWQIVVWMFGHLYDGLSDRRRRLMFPLAPVFPFFVGLAFLFHLSVSLGESVLVFSDGIPPVISGRLSIMGVSPFRREFFSQRQEADADAGFSVFRGRSAIRPSGHFPRAVPSGLVRP
jgi:hypothetical protein